MTKPKVLIFSTAYAPFIGGAEMAIQELADRLLGYDFVMITARLSRSLPKEEQVGRVLVKRFGLGFFGDKYLLALFGGWYGSRLHAKHSFAMLWAMMASYSGFAALSFKERHPTVPYLLSLQEGDLHIAERRVWWLKKRWLEIFRRADHIQVISYYLRDWAQSKQITCPVTVIPNGVDINRYDGELLRDPNRSEKIVITASRLVEKNGVEYLIRAMTLIAGNAKLWIAGDGPLRLSLERLTKSLGLADRVIFLGTITQEKLPGFLKQADVFCRPSLSEGQGIAFLEAMALGLPTIGTDVGGIPDFLHNPSVSSGPIGTGWLVSPKDPEAIAQAINFIIDPVNASQVETINQQAKKLIQTDYNWEVLSTKMSAIMEELCRSSRERLS